MAPANKGGRATLVEPDGGRIRFDFSEARRRVVTILTALTQKENVSPADIDKASVEVITYLVTLIASIKVTTKYKPWKRADTNPIESPHCASVLKKGFYLGWAALQDVVRLELIDRR